MLTKSIHIQSKKCSLYAGFTYKPAFPLEDKSYFIPATVRQKLEGLKEFTGFKTAYLEQIHSGDVITVTTPGFQGNGDALITCTPEIILTVKTADCIPLLVWDESIPVIAAIHAGWRGLKNNIVENTIQEILKYSENANNLTVLLGPHLKQCHFEVTEEFLSFFPGKYFHKNNKWFFDPTAYLYDLLTETIGISAARIIDFSTCTWCDSICFSYRRDHHTEERHIGYVVFQQEGGSHEI